MEHVRDKSGEVAYTKPQLINFTQNSSASYKFRYIALKLCEACSEYLMNPIIFQFCIATILRVT